MTGLNPTTDTIMSISCILTTSDLSPLDSTGFNAVIQHSQSQLSSMSDWCIRTHGASGLTQACLQSTMTAEAAAHALLEYIKYYIPSPNRALLAGNSIHADRAFLAIPPWNIVLEHLHYRLFDVSAMKEMVRRWADDGVLSMAPRKMLKHEAREDVLESIQEASFYKILIESMGVSGVQDPNAANSTGGRMRARLGMEMNSSNLPGFGPSQPVMNMNANRIMNANLPCGTAIPNSNGIDNLLPAASTAANSACERRASIPTSDGSVIGNSSGSGGISRTYAMPTSTATSASAPTAVNGLVAPGIGTKQGQEELDMQRNQGSRVGDVGHLGHGFRTDVP